VYLFCLLRSNTCRQVRRRIYPARQALRSFFFLLLLHRILDPCFPGGLPTPLADYLVFHLHMLTGRTCPYNYDYIACSPCFPSLNANGILHGPQTFGICSSPTSRLPRDTYVILLQDFSLMTLLCYLTKSATQREIC